MAYFLLSVPQITRRAPRCCFSQPERFDLEEYLRWLGQQDSSSCLGATALDVVGDARATLERSLPVVPLIRALGYAAALVAQDGLEELVVPWDSFDVLFVGGTTEWKLSAAARELVAESKRRGKWVHMGRVNSAQRLLYAQRIGCDSVDGTYLAFTGSQGFAQVREWLAQCEAAAAQRDLFEAA